MSRHRKRTPWYLYIISSAIGFLTVLFVFEVAFRILPVNLGIEKMLSPEPDARFYRHRINEDFYWSSGWNFESVVSKHSNNFGFLSDHDYAITDKRKLISVIGDSYIEAMQVKNKDTIHGVLQDNLHEDGRVYAFGVSGAHLPTYLTFARYANNRFKSDAMVFTIVGNDFDESACRYRIGGYGNWCFQENETGKYLMRDVEEKGSSQSLARSVLRRSAFLRYIVFNVGFRWRDVFSGAFKGQKSVRQFVGNVPVTVDDLRKLYAKRSVDAFFALLQGASGLRSNKILFVVDGARSEIYQSVNTVTDSFFYELMQYFIENATKYGYETINMHHVFLEDYQKHGERFEFRNDAHWNELGHFLVAREIAQSNLFLSVFGKNLKIATARPAR